MYGNTSGMHLTTFDNPATWKPQPVVWISDDSSGIGLGPAEVKRLKEVGILASCEYTRRDATRSGKVFVDHGTVKRCSRGRVMTQLAPTI